MAETVYVLGAGINRSIKDASHLRPPLATDLFKQALRHEMLDETGRQELKDLFAYIWRYWRYSVEDLREEPFDLEACFTMLQQQRIEADEDGDERQKESISQIEDQLTALLTRYLVRTFARFCALPWELVIRRLARWLSRVSPFM